VKQREDWNPFAPAMAEEAADRFLVRPAPARFMTVAVEATEHARAEIPAAVHVDGTARAQTVPAPDGNGVPPEAAPLRGVIDRFAELTGVPCVINTSFNLSGEPIAGSPRDALATFLASPLDALVMEDILIEKA